MRHLFISIAAFAFCAAGTVVAIAQVPDRVNDLVRQARELAQSAQDDASRNSGTFQNPFARGNATGSGVAIQGFSPGSHPGVDITDSAININVGGRNISVPRNGAGVGNSNAVVPGSTGGVTINGQTVGAGSLNGGLSIDPSGDVTLTRNGSTISTAAYRDFAAGMQAFGQADFSTAAGHLEKSVAANPDDPMPHPFYSLALFANGNYDAAAEFAYSAAATSPVWDWRQLRSYYSDPGLYAGQYEQLQLASRQANASPGTHFLLAWHHLMLGHRDVARLELERVLQVLPNDPVATNLLNFASQPVITPPHPMK